jgi:hypothetical protein
MPRLCGWLAGLRNDGCVNRPRRVSPHVSRPAGGISSRPLPIRGDVWSCASCGFGPGDVRSLVWSSLSARRRPFYTMGLAAVVCGRVAGGLHATLMERLPFSSNAVPFRRRQA